MVNMHTHALIIFEKLIYAEALIKWIIKKHLASKLSLT